MISRASRRDRDELSALILRSLELLAFRWRQRGKAWILEARKEKQQGKRTGRRKQERLLENDFFRANVDDSSVLVLLSGDDSVDVSPLELSSVPLSPREKKGKLDDRFDSLGQASFADGGEVESICDVLRNGELSTGTELELHVSAGMKRSWIGD